MYESFYGLTEKPFSILPDPEYLFFGQRHEMAYSMLEYAIINREVFSVICGDIGCGKTTLLRHLLKQMDESTTFGIINQTMQEVQSRLGEVQLDGIEVAFVSISFDPERDTPQVLKAYMESFDPSFTALRGSPEQVAQLAKDFKVYFKKVEGKTATSYTIDHTAASFVFDTDGKLRLYTRYGMGAKALADDLKILLK